MDKSLIKVAAMAREWSSVFFSNSALKDDILLEQSGKCHLIYCNVTCIPHHTCTVIERYIETSLQISTESHID